MENHVTAASVSTRVDCRSWCGVVDVTLVLRVHTVTARHRGLEHTVVPACASRGCGHVLENHITAASVRTRFDCRS